MPTAKRSSAAKEKQRNNETPTSNLTALDASLGYSLRRAQLSTYGEFTAAMQEFDVRPSQFAVLMLIRATPGRTQSAVSHALGIQKANFVALLDRLEERRLTERRRVGGDRRSSALYLTRTGEAFAAKIQAAHAVHETGLTARLGPKRSQQLLKLLHEFSEKQPPAKVRPRRSNS